MAALVAMERHLWLNLMGIKEKDRALILDPPLSPPGLVPCTINSKKRAPPHRDWGLRRHSQSKPDQEKTDLRINGS